MNEVAAFQQLVESFGPTTSMLALAVFFLVRERRNGNGNGSTQLTNGHKAIVDAIGNLKEVLGVKMDSQHDALKRVETKLDKP